MHLKAGGLAWPAKPVAHLLVLGAQRQPPHAALRRGAEFRGFVNRVPEPGGIDLQVRCGCRHETVPVMMARSGPILIFAFHSAATFASVRIGPLTAARQ